MRVVLQLLLFLLIISLLIFSSILLFSAVSASVSSRSNITDQNSQMINNTDSTPRLISRTPLPIIAHTATPFFTSTISYTPSPTLTPTSTYTFTPTPTRTITPTPIHWLVDLHMHTTCSDGAYSYNQMVEAALAKGFDTIAITDHAFCKDIIDACIAETRLVCIPGQEVTTTQHIVALGITAGINARPDNAGVIEEIHSRNALAIAAHPYLDPYRFDESDLMNLNWDGMECGIGSEVEKAYALETSRLHGIPCVYSSDAHHIDSIGRRHMDCSIAIFTPDDLKYALWNGLCQPVIIYSGY